MAGGPLLVHPLTVTADCQYCHRKVVFPILPVGFVMGEMTLAQATQLYYNERRLVGELFKENTHLRSALRNITRALESAKESAP